MPGIPADIFAASVPYPKPEKNTQTFENLDLFWEKDFKNGKSSYEAFKKITANITIGYAVEKWLEIKENPETRRKYRLGIEKVFNGDPDNNLGLGFDDTINSLDAQSATVGLYENILECWEAPKTIRQLCATSYAQLCDFIRTRTRGLIDPDLLPREKKAYHKTKFVYSSLNWERFIHELEQPFNLIAELVYLAASQNSYRLRVSDSRQNVLNLSTEQINFSSNSICFLDGQSYHIIQLCITYPKAFMDQLKDYIGNRTGFVFTNKLGSPVSPKTVERAFKRNCKGLKLAENITPVMLAWAGSITCHKKWLEEREHTYIIS